MIGDLYGFIREVSQFAPLLTTVIAAGIGFGLYLLRNNDLAHIEKNASDLAKLTLEQHNEVMDGIENINKRLDRHLEWHAESRSESRS